MKMPARVRPATHFHHATLRPGEEGIVSDIGIGLQMAAIIFQELFPARLAPVWVCSHTPPRHDLDPPHTARSVLCALAPVLGPALSREYRRCPRLGRPARAASAADT